MYTPRQPDFRPAMRYVPELDRRDMTDLPAAQAQHPTAQRPTRKPARRLTRNPVLAGIVNNALRLWK